MTRTIAITSGKGGVGKTSISVNIALHLAAQGYRTCLFDADLGLANINILLGLNPERTIGDVILKGERLEEIIISGCHGIDIIPGSSGVEKLADLDEERLQQLVRAFGVLDRYDFLFFDTSAGVSRQVIAFCLAASEVVLVITPEPTSLTDAYALLKILIRNGFTGKARIVVNQCRTHELAKSAYKKFRLAVKNHLQTEVVPLGFIYEDAKVAEAVSAQQPFLLHFPKATASLCIRHIAKNLLGNKPADLEAATAASFWARFLQLMRSPLSIEGLKKKPEAPAGGAAEEPARPAAISPGGVRRGEEPEIERRAAPEEPGTAPAASAPEALAAPEPGRAAEGAGQASPPPSAPPAAGPEMLPLLQELVQAVSATSQELCLIRQNLEKGGQGWQGAGQSGKGEEAEGPAAVLDYEAWVATFKRR